MILIPSVCTRDRFNGTRNINTLLSENLQEEKYGRPDTQSLVAEIISNFSYS